MLILFTCFQEVWTMQCVSGFYQFSTKQHLAIPPRRLQSHRQQISRNDIPTLTSPPQPSTPTTLTASNSITTSSFPNPPAKGKSYYGKFTVSTHNVNTTPHPI